MTNNFTCNIKIYTHPSPLSTLLDIHQTPFEFEYQIQSERINSKVLHYGNAVHVVGPGTHWDLRKRPS